MRNWDLTISYPCKFSRNKLQNKLFFAWPDVKSNLVVKLIQHYVYKWREVLGNYKRISSFWFLYTRTLTHIILPYSCELSQIDFLSGHSMYVVGHLTHGIVYGWEAGDKLGHCSCSSSWCIQYSNYYQVSSCTLLEKIMGQSDRFIDS